MHSFLDLRCEESCILLNFIRLDDKLHAAAKCNLDKDSKVPENA